MLYLLCNQILTVSFYLWLGNQLLTLDVKTGVSGQVGFWFIIHIESLKGFKSEIWSKNYMPDVGSRSRPDSSYPRVEFYWIRVNIIKH